MPKSMGFGQALVLTQEEADMIIEACPPATRALFSFARGTAARISEVLNLKFENIKSAYVILPKRICKGKKRTREVPMNDRLRAEYERWKCHWGSKFGRPPEASDYLFPGRFGDPKDKHMTRCNADHALRKVCKDLNIDGASTHSWRRTSLSNANDKGISLAVLKSISGHSSLDMLSRYLQTSDRQRLEAANAFG
jgi:integrase/recombinase XerD